MNWDNVLDVAQWAKDNLSILEGYCICEVKFKNLGEGFEVIVAYELNSEIILNAPKIVRRVQVDSYGHIVKTNEMRV